MIEGLDDVEDAYVTLLRHPYNGDRALYCQKALNILLDIIVDLTGAEAEEVQNHYEAIARGL